MRSDNSYEAGEKSSRIKYPTDYQRTKCEGKYARRYKGETQSPNDMRQVFHLHKRRRAG